MLADRRRWLPSLSLFWLAALMLSWVLWRAGGATLPAWVQFAWLGALIGSLAFVLTGWALALQQRAKPQTPPPAGQGIGLTLDELHAMDPSDFEAWVTELFQSRGYFAKNIPDSGDHGVDLWVVTPNGERAIVQCKRYRGVVGEPVVRDLYGVMQHENAPLGFLVTTGSISEAAGKWASGKRIELIDGAQLALLAGQQQGMIGLSSHGGDLANV